MSKLLREFYKLDYDVKAVNEAKEKKQPILLKGILQRAGQPNQNKRIYPKQILAREMENYQKAIKERRAVGCLDHPESSIVELKDVSHVIVEAHWENDEVWGTVEVLNTPNGETLKSLLESGIKIGISSRGVGGTSKNESGFDEVDNTYQLLCYDVVSEPSTNEAWLYLKEGKSISNEEITKSLTKQDKINRICNEILNKKF